MIDLDRQFEIIKQATAEGYKGNFSDLIMQEAQALQQQQQQQQQQNPEQPQVQQPQQPMPAAMAPPAQEGAGDLIQSYQDAPPGVANNPVGENVSNVVSDASSYQDGGVYRVADMMSYKKGGYTDAKVDSRAEKIREDVIKMAFQDKKKNGGYKSKYHW
tara:strand:- start:923 stop:1399 length:477 start_codon:yes stop_codon:yes gene_type:complete